MLTFIDFTCILVNLCKYNAIWYMHPVWLLLPATSGLCWLCPYILRLYPYFPSVPWLVYPYAGWLCYAFGAISGAVSYVAVTYSHRFWHCSRFSGAPQNGAVCGTCEPCPPVYQSYAVQSAGRSLLSRPTKQFTNIHRNPLIIVGVPTVWEAHLYDIRVACGSIGILCCMSLEVYMRWI